MTNNPIYDEIIIVGVNFNNKFNWYITNKLLWIMDLEKISKKEYDNYFDNQEINEIRKDIITLSEKNADIFLDRLKPYVADINDLRLNIINKLIGENQEIELEEYYPTLMLDFDKKILYSQYPEPFRFENYVPETWEGKYISFIDYIQNENKYWLYKGKNLLL